MNNNENYSVRFDKLDIVVTGIYSKGTMDVADELNKLKPFFAAGRIDGSIAN
jgi:hypothetical protein